MRSFDIAIAGAGPAGCAAAITLARRGYAVALLDKEQFPREKLCGDFVSPISRPIFRELDVEQEILAHRHEKVRFFRLTACSGENVEVPLSSSGDAGVYGLGLSRFDLDYTLVQKATGTGATLLERRRLREVKKAARGWCLTVDHAGASEKLQARLLIGADGRNSWIAHHLGLGGPPAIYGKAAGFQLRLTACRQLSGAVEIHLFPGGYAGLIGLGGNRVNLCLAIETKRLPKQNKISFLLEHCLPQNPHLKKFLTQCRWTGEERSAYPVYFSPRRCYGDSLLLVGDAARVNEPVTGEGIYFALQSGRLAASIIDRAFARNDFSPLALEPYESECMKSFRRRRGVNALIRFLIYRPALLVPLARLAHGKTGWLDAVVRGLCVPEAGNTPGYASRKE